MNRYVVFLLLAGLTLAAGCRKKPEEYNQSAANPEAIRQAERKLTEVIIHDIFSPPVASRIYAYSSLAAYEAMLPGAPQYRTLAAQLNGLSATPQPEPGQEYCFPLASVRAFLTVARTMTFSTDRFDEFEAKFYKHYQEAGVPSDVFERSIGSSRPSSTELVFRLAPEDSGGEDTKPKRSKKPASE